MTDKDFCDEAIKLFGCDEARISTPMKSMFLILGWKRKSDGRWRRENDDPVSFEYLEEKAVANGDTHESLRASMLEYKRLCDLPKQGWLAEHMRRAGLVLSSP